MIELIRIRDLMYTSIFKTLKKIIFIFIYPLLIFNFIYLPIKSALSLRKKEFSCVENTSIFLKAFLDLIQKKKK